MCSCFDVNNCSIISEVRDMTGSEAKDDVRSEALPPVRSRVFADVATAAVLLAELRG